MKNFKFLVLMSVFVYNNTFLRRGQSLVEMLSNIVLKNTFLESQSIDPHVPLVRFVSCPATVIPGRNLRSPFLRTIDEDVASSSTASAAHEVFGNELPHEFTTIMLRNIPNKYSQHILLSAIDSRGFSGKYDFFYL